jgi:hypothetical protein
MLGIRSRLMSHLAHTNVKFTTLHAVNFILSLSCNEGTQTKNEHYGNKGKNSYYR